MRTVDELIAIPKDGRRIKSVPKKTGHAQLDLTARAADGTRFAVFIRVLLDLPESFSIGLVAVLDEGPVILLRVNGDHGDHGNEDGEVFDGPHIHQFAEELRRAPPTMGTKPRLAVRIDSSTAPALSAYWRMFKQLVALSVSQEVDDAVDGIYRKTAQMAMRLRDEHDDTNGADDGRNPDGDPPFET